MLALNQISFDKIEKMGTQDEKDDLAEAGIPGLYLKFFSASHSLTTVQPCKIDKPPNMRKF